MKTDYENKISREDALKLACGYLQERIRNGSHPRIIFEHAVHIFNVARIAENIAAHTGGALNPDTAYELGLLHDIGRIKDETVTKVPHGVEGFNYLVKSGYSDLAPICLTHGFIDKNIKQCDYPTYSPKLLRKVKKYLQSLEYNDYDKVVQLADLFSRGKDIMSIRQRIEKNKTFYHIKDPSYGEAAYDVRDYIDKKYGINVENIVQNMFDKPVHSARLTVAAHEQSAPRFKLFRYGDLFVR